jgi:uncharacterized protein (TIGR00251 family)
MLINVKVKPNARQNTVQKIDESNFVVFTTTTPEDGKANKSVIELLSDFFRIAKSKIIIIRGQTSKNKVIEISI